MTIKIPSIVFDIDDTLLDYGSGIREYVNEHYGLNVTGYPQTYSLSEWLGVTDEKAYKIMRRFNKSWQFGCLQPIAGAAEVMQAIRNINVVREQHIELVALTKCGTDPTTVALRKANLMHAFGHIFSEVIIIDPDESKSYYIKKLKKYRDIKLHVDDFMGNAVDIDQCNVKSILFEREHNIEVQHKYKFIDVCKDWDTIFKKYITPIITCNLGNS